MNGAPPRQKRVSRRINLIIQLSVTCFLVALILSRIDIASAKDVIPKTNLALLFLAFGIFMARNLLAALRWRVLLASKGFEVPVMSLIRFYIVGNFFGLFLPAVVGSDIARGFYLYKTGVSKKESASSIVVERFLGIAALMAFALFALGFSLNVIDDNTLKLVVIVPSVLFLSILILFYASRIDFSNWSATAAKYRLGRLLRLIDSIHQYNEQPAVLLAAFVYSVSYQLTAIITVYLIALAIKTDFAFVYFLILLPIVWLVGLLPISLNGLGVREGTFVFLFVSVGMVEETAIIISLLFLLVTVAQGLIGGLCFLWDQQTITDVRKYPYSS